VDRKPSKERNHALGLSLAHPLPQNGLNSADAQERFDAARWRFGVFDIGWPSVKLTSRAGSVVWSEKFSLGLRTPLGFPGGPLVCAVFIC
jgi:hypothetical protein